MRVAVVHEASRSRFVARVDGYECVLDYLLAGSMMTITRTFVEPHLRGRGIAAALTERALDTARARDWKVIPACSYAAAWVRRHPDVRDLLG